MNEYDGYTNYTPTPKYGTKFTFYLGANTTLIFAPVDIEYF